LKIRSATLFRLELILNCYFPY